MAKATIETKIVTPAVPAVTEDGVILELSYDETRWLLAALGPSTGATGWAIFSAPNSALRPSVSLLLDERDYSVTVGFGRKELYAYTVRIDGNPT